ncbi:MAG: insulinase family protein, partial [Bacteroidales bacterium]|nr:insulinase family protein [Bacteroidales bacterium]
MIQKSLSWLLAVTALPVLAGEIKFEEHTLSNGLKVILHQDTTKPVVAVNIMYHVALRTSSPTARLCPFFEHLMFEGTEHIDRGQYFKMIQNAGGKMNAFTTFDKTNYYEILPSNQLELGLWMEAERMRSLKIDSVGVETQRSVVKEERRSRYENQPYGSVVEETFKRAFQEHPYKWVPIGHVQYIDEAQLDEFLAFHDHFYVPENAVLAVAGDIEPAKTLELINYYFGDIPAGNHKIYRPSPNEPVMAQEIRDTILDNIQLPGLFMSYHMPAQGTDDYYALQMLQNLLSGGESSRLYKALVDSSQLAVQVSAIPFG